MLILHHLTRKTHCTPASLNIVKLDFTHFESAYLRQGGRSTLWGLRMRTSSSVHQKDIIREARGAERGSVYSIWTEPRRAGSIFVRRRRWRTKRRTPPRATESLWKKKLDFWAPALLSSVSVLTVLIVLDSAFMKSGSATRSSAKQRVWATGWRDNCNVADVQLLLCC